MRKLIAYMLIALLLFTGCTREAGETPQLGNTPQPTAPPTPSPTPKPLSVLCVMDCPEEEEPDFFRGVRQAAENTGWDMTFIASPQGFSQAVAKGDYEGIIALRTNQETSFAPLSTAMQSGASVTIFDFFDEQPPVGAGYTSLDERDALQIALDTAIAYPPHDTPVRMLALFSEEGSPADTVYQAAIDEGKIFNRARHYTTDEKQSAEEFLQKQLDKYVVGLLDAIFVEDIALAQKAIDILNQNGREDMEVFCPPQGSMAKQIELYQRWVFPVAMGVDLYALGIDQVDALASLMKHGKPAMQRIFPTVMDVAEEYSGPVPVNTPRPVEVAEPEEEADVEVASAPQATPEPIPQAPEEPEETPEVCIPEDIIDPDELGGG